MTAQKVYKVSDLFATSWQQVRTQNIPVVYALQQQIKSLTTALSDGDEVSLKKYGYLLIMILRHLRRNPLLVDKIDVAQAVDIYNDLTFLNEPWYFFPGLTPAMYRAGSKQAGYIPEEYLARHTFDHFIYADNEFSSYIANQDEKYLRRLAATIYQREFDKESVEGIADKLKAKPWKLELVFYTFSHVREFINKRCKHLLPTAPESSEEVTTTSKTKPTGALWLKIKHRLSETPAFQGYENAGRANMYSALDYLEDLAQQKADAKS